MSGLDAHQASVRPPLAPIIAVVLAAAGVPGLAAAEYEGEHTCLAGKRWLAGDLAEKAFDAETGRDLRHFPTDRLVDYLHMKLELRFDDLEVPRFTAIETLRVRPIADDTTSLTLHAIGLDVQGVRIGTRAVEHFQDDETITLRFDPPLAEDEEHAIVFEYACEAPYAGLYFTPSSPTIPSYTAEVHTQGQAITNRHWFIAHDAPDERMTTELIVDVPAAFAVSSNGRLVEHRVSGDRATWHWLQDKPHVSYLVSLVIGQFDIVEIPHERVPMRVWVPRGLGDRVMQTYGNTGAMIDLFERRFGVQYPWARYDQLVVKNFGAGGMENTSATTMYPTAILDETALLDADLDGLIAHELAHQWSGDLLTCKEWAHIWLNEGFATFGSALWFEERDGVDGYLNSIRRSFGVARRDTTSGDTPMVSPVYKNPWEVFRRPGNPYPKGSSILHMLRRMLGEEVFWEGMHTYMKRHALGTVETHDLRYAMEEVSGRGLEWFFDQWCYRPGCPSLDVTVDYAGDSRELTVRVEQTQKIDADTPAFRFTLPIHVMTSGGDRTYELEVRERTATLTTVLDGVPSAVEIDPWLHVLATMNVTKPKAMWRKQATGGSTLPARHRAIEALGETDTEVNRHILSEIVLDGPGGTSAPHHALRAAAANALRGYGSDDARHDLLELLGAEVEDARVRIQLVLALRDLPADVAVPRLSDLARNDPSYKTRVAAIDGLARHEASEHADLIVELVEVESQHDDIRRAALRALAELDDPRGLDLAVNYAAYGYMDRGRPAAIDAIADLEQHDRDRAVRALLPLLDDPCRRPASAAGAALARIGDERALVPLKAIAETHADPGRREAAERWVETLEKKLEKEKGEDG